MATTRTSHAEWRGDLKSGKGELGLDSGAFEGQYSFASRFESGDGTNPEELIGAAHAACYSMALSNLLAGDGNEPTSVRTEATVHLDTVGGGPTITKIELSTRGTAPGLDADGFEKQAQAAKAGCPVSKALAGTEITLDAQLEG